MSPLAARDVDRPQRSETERREVERQLSAHLPEAPFRSISDADLNAMKAAFIRRFDEDLPRTETLMSVATIGYRMAMRDFNL